MSSDKQVTQLLQIITEHRTEAEERGLTPNDKWLYGMARKVEEARGALTQPDCTPKSACELATENVHRATEENRRKRRDLDLAEAEDALEVVEASAARDQHALRSILEKLPEAYDALPEDVRTYYQACEDSVVDARAHPFRSPDCTPVSEGEAAKREYRVGKREEDWPIRFCPVCKKQRPDSGWERFCSSSDEVVFHEMTQLIRLVPESYVEAAEERLRALTAGLEAGQTALAEYDTYGDYEAPIAALRELLSDTAGGTDG